MPDLKPCPFCGASGDSLVFDSNMADNGASGFIRCRECSAEIYAERRESSFEHVEGDLYRKVRAATWIDVAAEKWNRRAGR